MKLPEQVALGAIGVREGIGPVAAPQADVPVHGAAGLVLHGLRHEGRVDLVAHRRLADRALEQEHLVGQLHGVAVLEIDLQLGGAALVGQVVHVQALDLAVVVDVLDEGLELVHGIHAVGLADGFLAAGAADRRLQRVVRIGVALDEVELDLRRHDGMQAPVPEHAHDPAQDLPGRDVHRIALLRVAVVDDAAGGLLAPGHEPQRVQVGLRHHVPVRGIHHPFLEVVVDVLARHGLDEHGLRQAHAALLGELARRHVLAPRDARHVGHHGLDLVDLVVDEPFAQLLFIHGTHAR